MTPAEQVEASIRESVREGTTVHLHPATLGAHAGMLLALLEVAEGRESCADSEDLLSSRTEAWGSTAEGSWRVEIEVDSHAAARAAWIDRASRATDGVR